MTPDSSHLLISGATIVSVDPKVGTLDRGDILVHGDTIAAIGPDLTDRCAPDVAVIDGRGSIAVPGFVDAHVHAWEGQLRGIGSMIDFGEYLGLTAFGHGPRYRPEDNYAGTLATALRALDAGITTLVDNAHNAQTPAHSVASVEALLDAGIRGVHAVGSPFGPPLEHVPSTALALRDRCAGPLLNVRLFEVDPTPELWRFARDAGFWVSTELGPHTPGLDDRLEALHTEGLFTPEHALNHCYDLSERAWKLIGGSGAAVNLCPRSDAVFGLGSTVAPLEAALRHAAAVGLSNDNELSYGLSMFAEMQALTVRHRGERFRRAAAGDGIEPDPLTPLRLLEFATIGGAGNAGLSHAIGSLAPGKQADVVLVRRPDATGTAPTDPVTEVTAFAQAGDVDTVLVAGRVLKRDGRLVGIDLDGAREVIDRSRDYLLQPRR